MEVKTLISELEFKAIRSSGSGGQHVNKVSSKVELYFDIQASKVFTAEEKMRLKGFFKKRINTRGVLILSCSNNRSQHKNKAQVIKRLFNLLDLALKEDKDRILTKVPKAVLHKRLENKRRQGQKKANRKKPDLD